MNNEDADSGGSNNSQIEDRPNNAHIMTENEDMQLFRHIV